LAIGLRPNPLGSSQRSPDPLAGFRGAGPHRRGKEGGEKRGKEGGGKDIPTFENRSPPLVIDDSIILF